MCQIVYKRGLCKVKLTLVGNVDCPDPPFCCTPYFLVSIMNARKKIRARLKTELWNDGHITSTEKRLPAAHFGSDLMLDQA